MTNEIYEIYKFEIDKIIKNTTTIAVFLVGSSKNIGISLQEDKISDIDIFVFVNEGENQIREIKQISGIEFDVNYFSISGFKSLVNNREYFFLKEMKDAKIIYDKTNTADYIINLCKEAYLQGPNKISKEEKCFMKNEIESKISRLKNKESFDEFEYKFLTRLYLKDIIIGYFKISNKWIPKDKKFLKTLKADNVELFNLMKIVYKECDYEKLLGVYNYVFKDINISKNIKIIY